ncbi:MAG TPA: alanine racemase [Acidimicrobiales bacterium]|nr:alanine racemase [Acidimicrobiales bacterium]
MPEAPSRRAWAEVDLDAVRHNTSVLAELASPAALCVVVKADAYGHGMVQVARAALEAGATWLAVAVVEEGAALRQVGIAAPVLLLSEPPPEAMAAAVAARLTPTVYTRRGVEAAAAAAGRGRAPVSVHLKVDTGMHRAGADLDDAVEVARAVDRARGLRLEGLWTHLAVADDPGQDAYTAGQLERFEEARDRLAAAGLQPPLLHAANSAGAIAHPASRYDMVRCGIAVYGHPPSPALAGRADLRAALSLKAEVALVRQLPAGERISYGRRYEVGRPSTVATVPLGYADGVPRRLSSVGGSVLVGGRRRPLAGTVTMDQIMVDCGDDRSVAIGDEVVLIGRQGDAEVPAEEWAERLDTISYEILCGIGPRVARVYRQDSVVDEVGPQGALDRA